MFLHYGIHVGQLKGKLNLHLLITTLRSVIVTAQHTINYSLYVITFTFIVSSKLFMLSPTVHLPQEGICAKLNSCCLIMLFTLRSAVTA